MLIWLLHKQTKGEYKMTINNLQINQKVWVALNFVDNEMAVAGTVVGFTKKRIKCEIDGLVANYHPKNVHIREGK